LSFLDQLLAGVKRVAIAGVNMPPRSTLNFAAGATAADNPGTGSTDVTVGGGGGSGFVVYKPGATPSGNIYATWATAYAARQAISGYATIVIDKTLDRSGVDVLAGSYDLTYTKILGYPTPAGIYGDNPTPTLLLADGVTFTNLTDLENIEIDSQNTSAPVLSWSSLSGSLVVVMRYATIQALNGQPFFQVSGGATIVFYVFDQGIIGANTGAAIDIVGASHAVVCLLGSYHEIGSITSGGAGSLSLTFDSASIFDPTGFGGSLSLSPLSNANRERYTPAIPGNWSPAPSAVNTALDQLAARSPGGGLPAPLTPPSNGSWAVANWWIDPQNSSGLASDSNDGLTNTTPLLHYYALVAKWGTVSPVQGPVMLHFMSGGSDLDPVIWKPYATDTCAIETVPTVVDTSVAITVVASKNTALGANSPLIVDFAAAGGAAATGQLVRNTTSGKDSYAWIGQNVSGTTFVMSQPIDPRNIGNPYGQGIDTWTTGDTVDLLTLVNVDLVQFEVIDTLETSAKGVLYHVGIGGDSFGNTCILSNVMCIESRLARNIKDSIVGSAVGGLNDNSVILANCSTFAGLRMRGSCTIDGGINLNPSVSYVFDGATVLVGNDAILGDGLLRGGNITLRGGSTGAPGFFPTSGISGVYLNGTITGIGAYLTMDQTITVLYGSGSGQIALDGRSHFFNNAGTGESFQVFFDQFTAPSLVSPGILLNGASSGISYNGSGLLSSPIATTPGNIDAACAASHMGLFNIGGGSVGLLP